MNRFPKTALVALILAAVCLQGCPFLSLIVIPKDPRLEQAIRDELGKRFGFLTTLDMLMLTSLDAKGLGIETIAGLETATNLEFLNLDKNSISDLAPLENLIKLKTLNLDENEIFDLGPLAGLVNLNVLSLFSNQVADLTPLITNALAGGLGEGDTVILDVDTLDAEALQQAERLQTEFKVNVVLVQPAGGGSTK